MTLTEHDYDEARRILRGIPDATWDVTTWLGSNYTVGTVDVADRTRIAVAVLRAKQEDAA